MNAPTTIESGGEILTFLPDCHGEEFELRHKLRARRNAASALIASTQSETARCLAWLTVETATEWLYRPADVPTLQEIGRFAHRCLLTAVQAEQMADGGLVQ
jgi:hypothetical protein